MAMGKKKNQQGKRKLLHKQELFYLTLTVSFLLKKSQTENQIKSIDSGIVLQSPNHGIFIYQVFGSVTSRSNK